MTTPALGQNTGHELRHRDGPPAGPGLTRDQRNAFLASWLGWAMDAFDYFLLVFVLTDVAEEFDTSKTHVAVATALTLAARPLGAAFFGYWADRKGRRIPATRA
jgi:SHS family lactate transporter-like MFS transporter